MVKRPVEPGVETPADALRRTLREAEEETTLLLRGRGELLPLLRRLEAVAEGLRTLEAEGIDLRPERTRWESLCTQVQRGAERLVRHAQEGSKALQEVRQELQPPEEHWWWRLDLLAAEQRRRRAARTARAVGIALLVLALLGGAAYLFLRPDPLTAQKLRLYAAAERAIQEGRWEEGIARYQEATAVDPQDPEPWLRLGWAQERIGDEEGARASFQEAASRFADPFAYELALARLYVEAGDFARAMPHALRATELNPESPHAFYVLASAYEGSGRFAEALQALETCEKLAEAQGDMELVAMSRVRVGTLLQRMAIPTP